MSDTWIYVLYILAGLALMEFYYRCFVRDSSATVKTFSRQEALYIKLFSAALSGLSLCGLTLIGALFYFIYLQIVPYWTELLQGLGIITVVVAVVFVINEINYRWGLKIIKNRRKRK